jgi:hypothetical protein
MPTTCTSSRNLSFEVVQSEPVSALGGRIPAQHVPGVWLGQIDGLQDVGVEDGEARAEDAQPEAIAVTLAANSGDRRTLLRA